MNVFLGISESIIGPHFAGLALLVCVFGNVALLRKNLETFCIW
jgi:hypothetical protein